MSEKMNEKDLASEIMAEEPQPKDNIEELIKNETPDEPTGTGENDTTNQQVESFDPTIHRTDANGIPIRNKDGSYQRKRGRKAGQSYGTKTQQETAPIDDSAIQASQLGIVTAETIFTLCTGVLGDEWVPVVDKASGLDERQNMRTAWTQYYLATGKRDLPPSMIVCVAMLTYSAPRFRHENTRSKFGKIGVGLYKFFGWAKSKIFRSRKKDGE